MGTSIRRSMCSVLVLLSDTVIDSASMPNVADYTRDPDGTNMSRRKSTYLFKQVSFNDDIFRIVGMREEVCSCQASKAAADDCYFHFTWHWSSYSGRICIYWISVRPRGSCRDESYLLEPTRGENAAEK